MKKLVLSFLVICSLLLVSCGTPSGGVPPSLAKDSIELEQAIQNNMTLEKVYSLMTPELEKLTIIYPAMKITHRSDGKWEFEPKEGGSPGDIDAPYQVLVVYPRFSQDEGYYMLFFKDQNLFEDGRFDYQTSLAIEELLWTTESTD